MPDGLQYADDQIAVDGLDRQVAERGMNVCFERIFPLLPVLGVLPGIAVRRQIIDSGLPERQILDGLHDLRRLLRIT